MKLPLTAVIMTPHWAHIVDADNHTICEVYGVNAEADARAMVNAVNERASDKAEIARLRELIAKWR